MQMVIKTLTEQRRRDGRLSWEWIVDDGRKKDESHGVRDLNAMLEFADGLHSRNHWLHQPHRVEVWSEKGTIKPLLADVIAKYNVPFYVCKGNSGLGALYHEIVKEAREDKRPCTALYIGDFDPSGMSMSERTLPRTMADFGVPYILVQRVALLPQHLNHYSIPTFPASDKRGDKNHQWFTSNYGQRCAELDAMPSHVLHDLVEQDIRLRINWDKWHRSERAEKHEQGRWQRALRELHSQSRQRKGSR